LSTALDCRHCPQGVDWSSSFDQWSERSSLDVDFTAIDGALLEIAKQVKELDEIRTWTDTIRSNGEKILDRLRISTEKLAKQGEVLTERVADLKEAMKKG
jgi:phage-related minor tail protein